MLVTQKKQYALRAIFELAKRQGQGPVKATEIADAQAIPLRFLEVIMAQLRRGGLVISKRGFVGGYILSRPSDQIYVGEIFKVLDSGEVASNCVSCVAKADCPFMENCVFLPLWEAAMDALDDVFDKASIASLVAADNDHRKG